MRGLYIAQQLRSEFRAHLFDHELRRLAASEHAVQHGQERDQRNGNVHEGPAEAQGHKDSAGERGVKDISLVNLCGEGHEEQPWGNGGHQEQWVAAAEMYAGGDAAENRADKVNRAEQGAPGDLVARGGAPQPIR